MNCPIHVNVRMLETIEHVPRLIQASGFQDANSTRTVFRCPVPGCPRIECSNRSFYGSYGMRGTKDYMKYMP